MVAKLEEAFYRNKRSALLSSAVAIAITAFSIRVASGAPLYGLQIGEISKNNLILVSLMVCIYLNFSYILHYFTEVMRLNLQYLYLPVGVFLVAMVYSIGSLFYGAPLQHLFER
jgi:hypothetical protein